MLHPLVLADLLADEVAVASERLGGRVAGLRHDGRYAMCPLSPAGDAPSGPLSLGVRRLSRVCQAAAGSLERARRSSMWCSIWLSAAAMTGGACGCPAANSGASTRSWTLV
jgi:hypothetical protein